MTQSILERVTFRLVPGTAPDDFVALARATEAPLRAQPGFLSRMLTQGEDGEWTDLVLWRDAGAAQAAAEAMMTTPAFGPFMAAIAEPSVTMRHDALRWRAD
jgi:hypothetical protein